MRIVKTLDGKFAVIKDFKDYSMEVERFSRIDDAKRYVRIFYGEV